MINKEDRTWYLNIPSIKEVFVSHFKNIFEEKNMAPSFTGLEDCIEKRISHDQAIKLEEVVTIEEIEKTNSLASKKTMSPDGYGALFFNKAWSIVGSDVVVAIKSLFETSNLLKDVNCTIIALVPKCSNASTCSDFWLISCCNTIYKCITKIMVNKIKDVLPEIIDNA